MTFNSVGEILDEIDNARLRLQQSVADVSESQSQYRTAPDRWSVAEILEHLSLVEGQLARLFHVMVAKAEAVVLEPPAVAGGQVRHAASEHPTPREFAPVSIEDFVAPLRAQKIQAPDNARPSGTVAGADSLRKLSESRAALHALRPRIEKVDGSSVRYPHPAAGPIDIYQWLLFVGAHEDRHRLQIEALKQSPDFAAQT